MKLKQPINAKFLLPFCFLLIFFLAACGGEEKNERAQEELLSYPSYGEVVKKFYQTYADVFIDTADATRGRYSVEYMFQKKKEGWVVALVNNTRDSLQVVKTDLFWSLADKNYRQLSLPGHNNQPDSLQAFQRLFNDLDLQNFNVFPFYGYASWTEDVIESLGSKKQLNDTLLYAYARACGVKSMSLLGIRTDAYVRIEKQSAITPEKINKSAEFAQKSIRSLQDLQKQNPAFAARFSGIREKTENDAMLYWLHFTLQGRDDLARKMLPENFTPSRVQFGENILNSASPDAFLFTWDDSDTWPVLYAQQVKGIRKDVTVIPFGVVGLASHWNHFAETSNLQLSLGVNFYLDPRHYFTMTLNDRTEKAAPAREILQQMNEGKGQWVAEDSNGYLSTKVNVVTVPVPADARSRYAGYGKIPTQLSHRFYGPIQVKDAFVMDLIAANEWKRPVEFSACTPWRVQHLFPAHIWQKGLTAALLPATGGINNRYNPAYGNIAEAELNKNLNSNYKLELTQGESSETDYLLFCYRQCYAAAASLSLGRSDNKAAIGWVDACLKNFPAEKFGLSAADAWMVSALVEAGDMKQGKKLAHEIIQAINRLLSGRQLSPDEKGKNAGILKWLQAMGIQMRAPEIEAEARIVLEKNGLK